MSRIPKNKKDTDFNVAIEVVTIFKMLQQLSGKVLVKV